MRKPKKLSREELAPFVVELPEANPFTRPAAFAATSGSGGSSATPAGRGEALNWESLFGNANPVEVEVGFGKGLFLVSAGTAHPDVNYFGVEIVRKYQLYAANRVARRKLTNVKTCCADAKRVLAHHIPPGSVRTVHVFFPDPWWKTRHKKRLLFTDEFAAGVLRVLRPGGVLHFVTDVKDYFEMVTGLLATLPAFRELPPPAENTPQHDMDYLTNFERKFRKEGRPIYRSRYEKTA
ncbi:MAG: tRNA (guanosine(46)-N7)-methyltransferase TrmB [Gemmataceae bacterium]